MCRQGPPEVPDSITGPFPSPGAEQHPDRGWGRDPAVPPRPGLQVSTIHGKVPVASDVVPEDTQRPPSERLPRAQEPLTTHSRPLQGGQVTTGARLGRDSAGYSGNKGQLNTTGARGWT